VQSRLKKKRGDALDFSNSGLHPPFKLALKLPVKAKAEKLAFTSSFSAHYLRPYYAF
jgi:hypothetical protein